jgi:demethylmenaquinone methyltransferase/2-methoxy-6-polyprenyl-1,4-benzoquinol methylase
VKQDVLSSQKRYYAARAPEYDDWWFRRGRYAVEPEVKARWDGDIAEVEQALFDFDPRGDVLELAAGTGLWTRHLVRFADRVVALDANPEVLELNRFGAELHVVDLFDWTPAEQFDVCFFGFWLSHVPDERFDAFWQNVREALEPNGRVFLVDNVAGDPIHARRGTGGAREIRSVADGREFEIVKHWWTPEELAARVAPLGFDLQLRTTANAHFLYGSGS